MRYKEDRFQRHQLQTYDVTIITRMRRVRKISAINEKDAGKFAVAREKTNNSKLNSKGYFIVDVEVEGVKPKQE